MYSKDLIEAVLQASDIVTVISSYLHVEKQGRNYVALCPFHNDKHPSLSISKEKQIFKCFVCGVGGDAINFVQRYTKCSYPEAVRKVAEICNFHDARLLEQSPTVTVDPAKAKLYRCIDDLQTLYLYALSTEEAQKARDYLASRQIGEDLIERFKIGYAPLDGAKTVEYLLAKGHSLKEVQDIGIATARAHGTSDLNAGRLIFPLFNPRGQLVGFSARQIEKDDTAKYINTTGTPIFVKGTNLYNYHNVSSSAHRDGYCYLMEGFMDVMSAYKAGINNAVALMGTSLTPEQIQLLKRLRCEIRLCLDGDGPGQQWMMKNSTSLTKAGIPHRIVDYQGDLRDPDDIYKQDGKEALLTLLNRLVEPMEFYLSFYSGSKASRTPAERKKILQAFLPFLRAQTPGIEYEDALQKLANATGFDPDAIRRIANAGAQEQEEYTRIVASQPHIKKRQLSRLQAAERKLLYYMLKDKRAIEVYTKSVGSFYDDQYRLAANYIIDYNIRHPNQEMDVAMLCSSANMDDHPEIAELLTDIAWEKTHEPVSDELLQRVAKAISEEKRKQISTAEVEQFIQEGDEVGSMEALQEYLELRRRAFKKQ